MKRLRNNPFLLGLLFAGLLSLALFTLGGEFLHSQIHHHEDEESQQQCPVFQLLAQYSVITYAVVAAIFLLSVGSRWPGRIHVFVFQPNFLLPAFRAPPAIA